MSRKLVHRWLLLVPLVWQLAMVPIVNGVHLAPLGLPFPMVWQMGGVVLCVVVLRLVFVLDRRAGVETEEAEFAALTDADDRPTAASAS